MRTQAATHEHFETVTSYLGWDHDRLDAILVDVSRKVEAGQMEAARKAYAEFDQGLKRHIRLEEDLLFPLFEARTGVLGGPTAVMREEHREILRAIEIMRDGLEEAKAARFREGLRFFRETLPDHNAKEEHILYPATDRALSDVERAAFVARLLAE